MSPFCFFSYLTGRPKKDLTLINEGSFCFSNGVLLEFKKFLSSLYPVG